MSFFYEFLDDEFNEEVEPDKKTSGGCCEGEQCVCGNGESSAKEKQACAETEPDESEEVCGNCEELNGRIKELEQQVKNLQDSNLRIRAEFENFKKRTSKEKLGLYNSGQIDCVLEFLPFFDGVERGFEMFSEEADSEAFKGFKMLSDSFNKVLQKLEIESFGKKGDEFNPKYHNAIKTLEVEGFGNNLVYEVLQKGYCKGENVVRHAMVVVANP